MPRYQYINEMRKITQAAALAPSPVGAEAIESDREKHREAGRARATWVVKGHLFDSGFINKVNFAIIAFGTRIK
jgi:hypothetical protein